MGAMKAIYTDIQELQLAAAELDEESFIEYVQTCGWVSPSEVEIRNRRATVDLTATGGKSATVAHPSAA